MSSTVPSPHPVTSSTLTTGDILAARRAELVQADHIARQRRAVAHDALVALDRSLVEIAAALAEHNLLSSRMAALATPVLDLTLPAPHQE